MKTDKTIQVRKTRRDGLLTTHPWIYRSQIDSVSPGVQPGDVVRVLSPLKKPLGWGYYNQQSEISVRMLAREADSVDTAFFAKRIDEAFEYRKRWFGDAQAYRLISSEADRLPGLIVDNYGEVLVTQFLTLGMERFRETVLSLLKVKFPDKLIFDKSDAPSRAYEGMGERTGWVGEAKKADIVVDENGTRYRVYFELGQKTGFYLDQRENRILLSQLGIRGKVLDAFCYTGGFGLALAKAGCRVLGLDIQADAICQAEANRELNGLTEEHIKFQTANVFDELRNLVKAGEEYELVILDPPSFVKSKESVEGALGGYKEILLRGLKLVREGGLLAVFSCSYHVDEFLLLQTAMAAAHDARKGLKIMKFLKQSADHPIDPFVPETYYLKGFLFQVTSV